MPDRKSAGLVSATAERTSGPRRTDAEHAVGWPSPRSRSAATVPAPSNRSTPASSSRSSSITMPAAQPISKRACCRVISAVTSPAIRAIIVQNMAGAAGMVATKYLGEVASRDGTMLGYFTGSTQRYVSIPERFNVDFRSYEFIAVVPSGRIHFMRTDVRPGIKTRRRCRQRREHRRRRAWTATAEGYGDAADARHARRALQLRDRLQFQRPGDDRAAARRDQLLRRTRRPSTKPRSSRR